jgi:hypothetical protein
MHVSQAKLEKLLLYSREGVESLVITSERSELVGKYYVAYFMI